MTEKLLPSYEQMLLYRDELGVKGVITSEHAAQELIDSHRWMRNQLGYSMEYLYELEKMGVIATGETEIIPDIESLVEITNTFRIQREAMLKVIKKHKLDNEYKSSLEEILSPKINKGVFEA